MNKIYNSKIKAETISILSGEYYTSNKKEIIYTILGSCVSVALFDNKAKIGGMNHFMLPGSDKKKQPFFKTLSGRYGINAMELLINAMLKLGAARSRLSAKVFGGGKVLQATYQEGFSIADKNIEFALEFLKIEKIPIISSDTGGTKTRRIVFFSGTGKIYQQKLNKVVKPDLINENLEKITNKTNNDFTLFKQ